MTSPTVSAVSAMRSGFFDHETDRVTSAENPYGAKVFTHVLGIICFRCARNRPPEIMVGRVATSHAAQVIEFERNIILAILRCPQSCPH